MNCAEAMQCAGALIEHLNTGALSISDKLQIEELHEEVLKRPIRECNCQNRHSDALIEVYNYLKRYRKMKETCNYKLKAGVVLQKFGTSDVYTNNNLTDEVASEFLSKFPGMADQFEVIPDVSPADLEPLNNDFTLELAERIRDGSTKKALKEEYKKFELDGKKLTGRLLDRYLAEAVEMSNRLPEPEDETKDPLNSIIE